MKFDKELLSELICCSVGEGFDGLTVVSIEDVGKTRWSYVQKVVFSFEEKLYEVEFKTGATEMQDERPFEYDDEEIECVEVEPYEVVTIKYRAKQ